MNYAIGVDLGGTSIKYAVVSSDGIVLHGGTIPTMAEVSSEVVIGQILRAIEVSREFARREGLAVSGIGVGTPGVVDCHGRTVLGGADNISGWSLLPLADRLEQQTGLKTKICNDACAMALAEQSFGAAKGCTDVVFVTIGTGIGGALILDGKMRSTEFCHVPFIANGMPCNCGSLGCFEAYASTRAMVNRFCDKLRCEGLPIDGVDGRVIVERYMAEDPMAIDAIEQECYYVGRGIGGFINTFSPQRVVVGGGISESGEFFIRKVSDYAMRNSLKECSANTSVVAAVLGNAAGVVGAAQLIFDNFSSLNTKAAKL